MKPSVLSGKPSRSQLNGIGIIVASIESIIRAECDVNLTHCRQGEALLIGGSRRIVVDFCHVPSHRCEL